jgi:hypothetical protein
VCDFDCGNVSASNATKSQTDKENPIKPHQIVNVMLFSSIAWFSIEANALTANRPPIKGEWGGLTKCQVIDTGNVYRNGKCFSCPAPLKGDVASVSTASGATWRYSKTFQQGCVADQNTCCWAPMKNLKSAKRIPGVGDPVETSEDYHAIKQSCHWNTNSANPGSTKGTWGKVTGKCFKCPSNMRIAKARVSSARVPGKDWLYAKSEFCTNALGLSDAGGNLLGAGGCCLMPGPGLIETLNNAIMKITKEQLATMEREKDCAVATEQDEYNRKGVQDEYYRKGKCFQCPKMLQTPEFNTRQPRTGHFAFSIQVDNETPFVANARVSTYCGKTRDGWWNCCIRKKKNSNPAQLFNTHFLDGNGNPFDFNNKPFLDVGVDPWNTQSLSF